MAAVVGLPIPASKLKKRSGAVEKRTKMILFQKKQGRTHHTDNKTETVLEESDESSDEEVLVVGKTAKERVLKERDQEVERRVLAEQARKAQEEAEAKRIKDEKEAIQRAEAEKIDVLTKQMAALMEIVKNKQSEPVPIPKAKNQLRERILSQLMTQ